MEILTPAALSAGILELIKWLIKFKKGQQYDFPVKFYLIMLPILNVAVIPALVLLRVPGFAYPSTLLEYVYAVGYAALASLLSVFVYNQGMKPMKDYAATQKEIKLGIDKRKGT